MEFDPFQLKWVRFWSLCLVIIQGIFLIFEMTMLIDLVHHCYTVRNRMKSVKNIQKITKAMKMVAASKLRAIQTKAENSRGLWQPFTALLGDSPSMYFYSQRFPSKSGG